MSNVIIVDEQDASVVFTGEWDHLADPVQYKGIGTGSSKVGTTCSFNFTGTSIAVISTVVTGGGYSVLFTLDGTTSTNSTTGLSNTSNVNAHSYHGTMFSADNLADANHQLTMTVAQNTDTINFFFDYFLYTASPKTNLLGASLFVDDRDPSLSYSGNWRLDTADSDFRHTSRAADNTSEASLTIPFSGNNIQYYGIINSGAVGDMLLAEFVLDGTLTTTYAPAAQTSDVTYNNKLFDSGPISQGPHTLVVTPKNDHLVWIDYLLVKQGVTSLTTSAPAIQTASQDILQTSVPSSSQTTSPPVVSSAKSVPIGAIIGAIVALFVAIFVAILALLLLRRRRLREQRFRGQAEAYIPPSFREPFLSNPRSLPTNDWPDIPAGMVMSGHSPMVFATRPDSERSMSVPPSNATVESQIRMYNKARREGVPVLGESSTSTSIPDHIDSGVRINRNVSVLGSPPTYTPE